MYVILVEETGMVPSVHEEAARDGVLANELIRDLLFAAQQSELVQSQCRQSTHDHSTMVATLAFPKGHSIRFTAIAIDSIRQ